MATDDRPWWERNPDDLVGDARAAYKQGRLGLMFRRCVQALWLNPDHPIARRGVATFFVREGKYPLAMLYDPDHPALPKRIPRPSFGRDWVHQSVARYIGAPPGDFAALALLKRPARSLGVSTTSRGIGFAAPLEVDDEGLLWLDEVEPVSAQSARQPRGKVGRRSREQAPHKAKRCASSK